MVQRADVVFVNHWRTEGEAADATEGHQESLHGAVCVRQVVGMSSRAVVEAAHQAERRAGRELRARLRFQLALRSALSHAHAQ